MEITLLWEVMLCSSIDKYKCSGGTCCLHLCSRRFGKTHSRVQYWMWGMWQSKQMGYGLFCSWPNTGRNLGGKEVSQRILAGNRC